jgi:thymidylate kinase
MEPSASAVTCDTLTGLLFRALDRLLVPADAIYGFGQRKSYQHKVVCYRMDSRLAFVRLTTYNFPTAKKRVDCRAGITDTPWSDGENPKTMKHGDEVIVDASTDRSEPSRSRKDFLFTLFSALDSNQVRYCVLHSWEGLPEELPSDLDLGVHPSDIQNLPSVFRALGAKGYRPVQCFNYFAKAFYFIFAWFEGAKPTFVAVDIISEHRRSGLIVPSGEALVAGRSKQSIFWIPDPAVEFAYLLAKKTWKGSASPRQVQRLKLLVAVLGRTKAETIAHDLFRERWKRKVVEACANGEVGETLSKLRMQPWLTSLARSPLKLLLYLFHEGFRLLSRWFQPTGLFVALLGPDGVGKSTIARELIQLWSPGFRRHRIFHWRPSLIGRMRDSRVTEPHEKPVRGTLKSVAHLVAFLLDYWLGFLLIIRPLVARSTFVIFDRYFHDVLVDPWRYRYGGPMWFARLLGRCVPAPDLTIVFDAPKEVILSRKCEVPSSELCRQRESYKQLARDCETIRFVKTNQDLEKTLAEASEIVMDYLAQRFQRRNTSWLTGGSTAESHTDESIP